MKASRVGVSVVAVAAVVAAAVLWWSGRPAMAYQSEPVARQDIEATVTAIGTLQPRSYVDVGAQVSGQILKLKVAPGAEVAKGDLLVEIDPSVQRATVMRAVPRWRGCVPSWPSSRPSMAACSMWATAPRTSASRAAPTSCWPSTS